MSISEYLFNNVDFTGPLTKIRDVSGIKIADVWFYGTKKGEADIWEQMIPTPSIQMVSNDILLSDGGVIAVGDVILGQIPTKKYSEEDLFRTGGEYKFYFVIRDPNGVMVTKGYTPNKIIRKDLFFYTLSIERFKSLKVDEIDNSFKTLVGI